MRTFYKLLAGVATATTVTALAVVPAIADPPKGVTPKATDVTAVGSDTLQFLVDQFSHDYNKTIKASAPHLYSWDATNPKTGAVHDPIVDKKGCAKNPRPNGSSEGILAAKGGPLALTSNLKDGKNNFCTDLARSSRSRNPATDPPLGPGGIIFLTLAKDAVTWASNKGSPAPKNLSTAQLAGIYTCHFTKWNQVGGKSSAKINAQLPQTGSGTLAFFLKAIGVASAGPCVNSLPGETSANLPEENEGVNKFLQSKNTIYPYSIGKYIAQTQHSAKCFNSKCTPVGGKKCNAGSGGTNLFGCDEHGNMVLASTNGTKPTVGTGKKQTINPAFSPNFVRLIFTVVRWTKTGPGVKSHIPANVNPIFGPGSWSCHSKTAHNDMINYGFLPTPFCGAES